MSPRRVKVARASKTHTVIDTNKGHWPNQLVSRLNHGMSGCLCTDFVRIVFVPAVKSSPNYLVECKWWYRLVLPEVYGLRLFFCCWDIGMVVLVTLQKSVRFAAPFAVAHWRPRKHLAKLDGLPRRGSSRPRISVIDAVGRS